MKKSVCFIVWFCVAIHMTDAQINTGTIVVFQLTKNEFVIAADSRGMFIRAGTTSNNECKIAAFKSHSTVFTTGGTEFYKAAKDDPVPSWSVIDEAKRAIVAEPPTGMMNATDAVDKIARIWEQNMMKLWTQMIVHHREAVLEAASLGKGYLNQGVFVVSRRGSLAMAWTAIIFTDGKLSSLHPDYSCTSDPCAFGKMNVIIKYWAKPDETFMIPPPPSMKSWNYELLRAIRLIDLTIAEDQSGMVHGPVDAAELLNGGTIRWRQKKESCPESQD